MTTKQENTPMSAIARDLIHFSTMKFPAGASRKVLDAFTASRQVPDRVMHAGKSYPVREMFYDWLHTKQAQ